MIETQRLFLREMTLEDYSALCGILQDPQVMYAYEHAFSDEEVRAWLNWQLENYTRYGFGLWGLVEKATGRFIGQCGLTMQNWSGREVLEIGYHLRRDHWHQGFATEAATACKHYAFETLRAPEVFSIIRENNIPSQRVAQRNGMSVVGSFTKHYYGANMPHLVFAAVRDPAIYK